MNRIKFKRRIGQVRCAAKYYIVYVISKLYRVHDNASFRLKKMNKVPSRLKSVQLDITSIWSYNTSKWT